MTMPSNESPDFIEIEIDNFVSPNAANDVPSADFVALELDAPIAVAESPALESTDAPIAVAESPALESTLAALAPSPVTGSAPAFGSIRSSGYIAPTGNQAFDDSPLTPEEIAERNANLARRAARLAAAAARPAVARATVPSETPSDPIPHEETVILAPMVGTVAVNERQCGMQFAWNPADRSGHEIPRAEVCALLDAHGLSAYHPAIPMPKGLFGVVFKGLNNAEAREEREEEDRLMARCVTRNDMERLGLAWPENLESRYIVGKIDASIDLGSLGSKELVCSLVKTETGFECQFTGGTPSMRNAISARFDALQGNAIMNVTTLLKWYCLKLETLGAIRSGYSMLIVDNGTDLARANIEIAKKLTTVLQGPHEWDVSPVMGRRLAMEAKLSRNGMTHREFSIALVGGMLDAIRDHGKVFAKELADAQEFARKQESAKNDATPASIELAVRRAMIGSERTNSKAIGLLATLRALAARAASLVEVVGRDMIKPAIDACEALRAQYAPLCKGIDATSEMFSAIELD